MSEPLAYQTATTYTGPVPTLPAEWTFWADTIIGSEPLGPVHPTSFSYTRELSGFGAGEMTIPVESSSLTHERMLALWSYRIWCYYGGTLVWCGVPTGIVDAGRMTVSLTLTEITGYLTKRVWDIEPYQDSQGKWRNWRAENVEQTEIAAFIASPLSEVGVNIVTSPGPGKLRTREYEYLESEHRGQLLINLVEVLDSPQFRSEYAAPNGRPRATLKIAYPRVGVLGADLGVTVPEHALGYGATWDADKMRTRTFAAGEAEEATADEGGGEGEAERRPVVVKDRPQAGLPRLDAVDDWPSVILIETLTERAETASVQYARPVLALAESAPVNDPPVSSYGPGDDVTVRVVTPLLDGGLEYTGQLQTMAVNAGAATVEWTVVIELPPPKPRPSLTERLGSIDLMIAASFRRRRAPVA